VIAGSTSPVLERLIEMTDTLGRFGTLVMVAQDWDDPTLWRSSMKRLAEDITPTLSQYADQLPALD
jgi:predicted secreted protein